MGLLYLDSPHLVREFTPEDLSLVTVMANIAAIRLRLYMCSANSIQKFLTRRFPRTLFCSPGVLAPSSRALKNA
jgi:hypothetical protein